MPFSVGLSSPSLFFAGSRGANRRGLGGGVIVFSDFVARETIVRSRLPNGLCRFLRMKAVICDVVLLRVQGCGSNLTRLIAHGSMATALCSLTCLRTTNATSFRLYAKDARSWSFDANWKENSWHTTWNHLQPYVDVRLHHSPSNVFSYINRISNFDAQPAEEPSVCTELLCLSWCGGYCRTNRSVLTAALLPMHWVRCPLRSGGV